VSRELTGRELYAVKRAAWQPNRHLDMSEASKTINHLIAEGLVVEHGRRADEPCGCGWYVLTDAGVALAAEHGIVRRDMAGAS